MPNKGRNTHPRQEEIERKKEERALRNSYQKEQRRNEYPTYQSYLADDENVDSFKAQLRKLGLDLRDIPADGNCLFRALGDQLTGSIDYHLKHRIDVVNYMKTNREDFEPFVEDDIPFDRHVSILKHSGTFAGNDAIVAFARLHQVNVIIHQYLQPCINIIGSDDVNARQLHISYHNGDHYSSVRYIGDYGRLAANVRVNNTVTPQRNYRESLPAVFNAATYSSSQSVSSASSEISTSPIKTWNAAVSQEKSQIVKEEKKMNNSSTGDCVARIVRGPESIVQEVVKLTACTDTNFIHDMLREHGYDVNETVMAVHSKLLFEEKYPNEQNDYTVAHNASQDNLSSNSSDVSTDSKNVASKKLSSRQKKELKKRERKQRAEEGKRAAAKAKLEQNNNHLQTDTANLVKRIDMVTI